MSLREVRRVLRRLRSWSRAEDEMREEMALHLQQRADDLVAAGLTREHAARRARLEFGAVEAYKEQCRDAAGFAPLRAAHGLGGDLRLAGRRLRAAPLFLLFAVASLAAGVAVTTTVCSVLSATLWRPVGIHDPATAAFVMSGRLGVRPQAYGALSVLDADDLRASQRSFASLALSAPLFATLAGPATAETVAVEGVSGSYFATVGATAVLGRTLDASDDERMAAVAVLSDRAWRSRFDADPRVVGRVVRLGGRSFQVAGVAPPWLDGVGMSNPVGTAAWIPLRSRRLLREYAAERDDNRNRSSVTVIGRLRAGVSMASAGAEVATIGRRLDAAYPLPAAKSLTGAPVPVQRRWSARGVADTGASGADWMASLILVIVALVLMVACTNLANLTLARGAARQHEFAVRRALGASRWRLVRGLVAESALVALGGGAVAYVFTRLLVAAVTIEVPTLRGAYRLEPALNVPALAVAFAALLLSLLVFGLEPALQLTRTAPGADLSQGTTTVAPRTRRHRALLRWQVAVSVCLLLVTAVFVRVIVSEARHDPGIDLDRLAMATVFFPVQSYDEARARQTLDRALRIARETPGIESACLSSGMPFGLSGTPSADVKTAGGKADAQDWAHVIPATPEVFRTLGVAIVEGRPFDGRDEAGAPQVAVISEQAARALFGGRAAAIGRQMNLVVWQRPPAWVVTVVGVARDTDTERYMKRGSNTIYVPFAQHYQPFTTLVARTPLEPASAARLLQAAVRRADPDLGTGTAGSAWALLAGVYVAAFPIGVTAAGLGLLTLLLAMVGLYGVMSEAVTRRTQEFGIRISLGAAPAQVKALVLRHGFRPIVEGVVIGLGLGVAARVVVRAIVLAPIDALDLPALVAIPALLFLAGFAACYLPARHASRVDPNVALRAL